MKPLRVHYPMLKRLTRSSSSNKTATAATTAQAQYKLKQHMLTSGKTYSISCLPVTPKHAQTFIQNLLSNNTKAFVLENTNGQGQTTYGVMYGRFNALTDAAKAEGGLSHIQRALDSYTVIKECISKSKASAGYWKCNMNEFLCFV